MLLQHNYTRISGVTARNINDTLYMSNRNKTTAGDICNNISGEDVLFRCQRCFSLWNTEYIYYTTRHSKQGCEMHFLKNIASINVIIYTKKLLFWFLLWRLYMHQPFAGYCRAMNLHSVGGVRSATWRPSFDSLLSGDEAWFAAVRPVVIGTSRCLRSIKIGYLKYILCTVKSRSKRPIMFE
jgi:hypothetical protein